MTVPLHSDQRDRYSRQLMIDLIDEADQARMLEAAVLVVGAGGLGSPVIQYLAAAGVGRLGIVDSGRIKRSNLQRQVLYTESAIDTPKVDGARRFVESRNQNVTVDGFDHTLTVENAESILEGYDIVVDCVDSFNTRFLLNDLSRMMRVPLVHGAIYGFDGQCMTFAPGGACYRCLVPSMPDSESIPSGESMGVFPPVPGTIGCIQANEVLKLILDIGAVLDDRLLRFHGLDSRFTESPVERNPDCPVCGESNIDDIGGIDYDGECVVY